MKKIIIILILIISISYCHSQDKVVTLKKGKTYNQKLLKGGKDRYKINLKEGDFCSLIVMQKGVDVIVDLLGPTFKKRKSVDTPNGNNGPEKVEFVADADGAYYLDIYPLNDFMGMTEAQKNQFIEQNQGYYEIGSISVLSKEEYTKKISEDKLRRQKISDAINFGLEKRTTGKNLPDNWTQWGMKNYQVTFDTLEKHSGKVSVLIEAPEIKTGNTFGCVADSIPAVYNGSTIELRGYMKIQNVSDGFAGLFLRIDGTASVLQFDNMQNKMIGGTSDWTEYSVTLSLPEDAKTIIIGALLTGTGKLWVDDFQILIDGVDISLAEMKEVVEYKADNDKEFDNGSDLNLKDLTNSQIEDLTVLGKVWGFLKYYDPAIAKGEYNWDYELFRIIPKIIKSANKEERNNVFSGWVDGLGAVNSATLNEGVSGVVIMKPDLEWINSSTLGEKLTSRLNKIKDAQRTNQNYYIGKSPGVGNPQFRNERPYLTMGYPDAGFRLLSLYRYWNMIQYYFPDKELIGENWNDILKEYIPEFINASNELEYKLTALSLIARIHDTHANIWGKDSTLINYKGKYYAPVVVTFVEDKAVVTDYYDQKAGENSGLQKGDVIETIDNKPVDEIVKERLPLTPASNYPTQLRNISDDLLRAQDSLLSISYERNNSTVTSQLRCYTLDEVNIYNYYQRKDTCFKIINSDIAYLYPGTIKNAYLPEIMPEVMKTKGLIIDFRCYPSDFIVFSLSEYLQPDSVNFVKFSGGSITSPGFFTMTDDLKVGKKNEDYYKGKVVIIVNELTQSSAEYHSMAFRTAPNATVIGSTTAGADGNVSEILLPGGIRTMISGIGVYYPDGRGTQRVGIVPDMEIKPTIKGIREGRDELLERAIEIINSK